MGRLGIRVLAACAIGAATVAVGSPPAIHAAVVDTAAGLSPPPGGSEPDGPATSNPGDRDDSDVVEATLPGSSEPDEPVAVTTDDDSETLAILALVVAGVGLVVAVAAVMLARRRQPPDAGPG